MVNKFNSLGFKGYLLKYTYFHEPLLRLGVIDV